MMTWLCMWTLSSKCSLHSILCNCVWLWLHTNDSLSPSQEPSSGCPTLVTLKVDPDGFFLYWTGGANMVSRKRTPEQNNAQANGGCDPHVEPVSSICPCLVPRFLPDVPVILLSPSSRFATSCPPLLKAITAAILDWTLEAFSGHN